MHDPGGVIDRREEKTEGGEGSLCQENGNVSFTGESPISMLERSIAAKKEVYNGEPRSGNVG